LIRVIPPKAKHTSYLDRIELARKRQEGLVVKGDGEDGVVVVEPDPLRFMKRKLAMKGRGGREEGSEAKSIAWRCLRKAQRDVVDIGSTPIHDERSLGHDTKFRESLKLQGKKQVRWEEEARAP
jgi:hypothetical protein